MFLTAHFPLFLLGVGFTINCILSVNGETVCPDGWTAYVNNCYTVTSATFYSDEAAAKCSTIGGYLAVPRSQDENNFVLEHLVAANQPIWIGCIFDSEIESYKCNDGADEVEYRNWRADLDGWKCIYMLNGTWWEPAVEEDCRNGGTTMAALCKRAPLIPELGLVGSALRDVCCKTLQRWRLLIARLARHVLREAPAPSIKICVLACEEEPLCRSINFIQTPQSPIGGGTCQLNNATRFDAVGDLALAPCDAFCVYGEN
ncbi:uncharacterized protein LOC110988531 isoform X2 [Acanthaster planci]|nr:uncharacterized protein LOC110988531 isoform X2 [Acanthaster planci]